ncbi:MAG: hypothetical protein ABSB61_04745 [Anaerolineales bacterium]|jgi:multidrug resistance efflux pump
MRKRGTGRKLGAEATVEDAPSNLGRGAKGADPEKVTAAAARAEAAMVRPAQANLGLTDGQIARLTVTARGDGMVWTHSVRPEGTVNPGGVAQEQGACRA